MTAEIGVANYHNPHIFPDMHTIAEGDPTASLASLIDDLARLREPITILRNGQGAAVILSADEYASIQETLYLLSTPANTERVRQGLADYAAGKARPGELCD